MNARDCPPSTSMAYGSRRPGQQLLQSPSPQLVQVLYHIAVAYWEEHHRLDCRSVDVAAEVVVVVDIASLVKVVWATPGDSDVVDGYAMHDDWEEMS